MLSRKYALYLLVMLTLVVSACSSTRIAYGFLDWMLNWQVEKYVSLNKEQEAFAKKEIAAFHHWHRHTQLPLYADYIRGLKTRLLSGNISGKEIHAETDQVQVFLDTSIEQLIPALVELAASLSDEQTKELQRNLKKEREEYKEKYIDISEEKRYDRREKQLRKHFERLIGSLTKEQKTGLHAWARAVKPYEQLTFDQQVAWAQQADAAMQARDNREALEEKIRGLMFYHAENWGEEAENIIDTNQELTWNYIASVFNSMDDKQKAHLEKTLDGYIRDFEVLAKAEQDDKAS